MDPIVLVAVSVLVSLALLIGGYMFISGLIQGKIADVDELIRRGRFKDAIPRLEAMLEKDERSPKINFMLGSVHEMMGGYQTAAMQYRRILKFGRFKDGISELMVRKHLAESLKQAGNYTDAKNEYLILTRLEPHNYENFYETALLFQRGKAYPNALKFYKQAVVLNLNHFNSWSGMGRTYFAMHAYSDARDALSKAAELEPNNRENLYYLGQAHRFLGEHIKALASFEKAERDEALRARCILARGLVYFDQGSYESAIAELDRGLAWADIGSELWMQFHYLFAAAAERSKDIGAAIDHWEQIQLHDAKYRDVSAKLTQYAEFRTNDQIKELLVANRQQFESIARSMAANMNLRVSSAKLNNEMTLTLLCTESQSGGPVRGQGVAMRVFRDMAAVTETQIREFQDMMKFEGAARGIFMTVGEFAPSALEYAANRPFDLINGTAMVPRIKGAIR